MVAEVNPTAQAARIKKREDNNIIWNDCGVFKRWTGRLVGREGRAQRERENSRSSALSAAWLASLYFLLLAITSFSLSAMSRGFPIVRMVVYSTGIMASGYALMKTTVPTPEQTYDALAPDLKKRVDAARAARLARENTTAEQLQAQQNDPDSQKPAWSKSRPPTS